MTITVQGNLDINGASGNTVTWTNVDLSLSAGGTHTASWCIVSGSTATGNTIDATDNCTDNGGNSNWTFAAGGTTIEAALSLGLNQSTVPVSSASLESALALALSQSAAPATIASIEASALYAIANALAQQGNIAATGFPVVESVTPRTRITSSTTITAEYPATVNAGDLLIFAVAQELDAAYSISTTETGVSLVESNRRLSCQFGLYQKTATGSESGTFTFSGGASPGNSAVAVCYRISNWGGSVTADSTASSGSTPNAPSVTASWGSEKNLFLPFVASTDDAETVTNFGSDGYATNGRNDTADAGQDDSTNIASSYQGIEAATDDPGAWTLSNTESWVAMTLVIQPGTVAPAIEAALSMGVNLAALNTSQAAFEAAASLGISNAIQLQAFKDAVAEVAFAIQESFFSEGEVSTGAQIIEAVLTFGLQQAVANSAAAVFEAATNFGLEQATSSGGLAALNVTMSLGVQEGFTPTGVISTGPQTFEAVLSIGVVQGIESLTVANLYAATTLNAQLAALVNGGKELTAALSYAIQHSTESVVAISIEGAVTAAVQQAFSGAVQADLTATATLAHQAALQLVAGAILEAGLELSAIKSVTTSGFKLVVGIVTPDARTITIQVQDGTIDTGDQDRTFTIN